MSLNKKILALAIASALPATSFAVVDLDAPSAPKLFTNEVAQPAHLGSQSGLLDVEVKLGVSVVTTSKYIRFDFPGTTLDQDLTTGSFETRDNAPAEAPVKPGDFTIFAGGKKGDNYVVVEISNANLSNGDTIIMHLPATAEGFPVDGTGSNGSIVSDAATTHKIYYRIFSVPDDALNWPTQFAFPPLVTKENDWYGFAKGLNLSCAQDPELKKIAFLDDHQFAQPQAPIEDTPFQLTRLFDMVANTNSVYAADGSLVEITDYLPPLASPVPTTFTVSGDFTFISDMFAEDDDTPPFFVSNHPIAIQPSLTSGIWTVNTNLDIPMPVDGQVWLFNVDAKPMKPSDYSLAVIAGTGAVKAGLLKLDAPADGVCARLNYSGSSDRVDFGLTPGATTKQYLRATNPTDTAGGVQFTMWTDNGSSVSFNLDEIVVGGNPLYPVNSLGAQSSTPLVDINDMYKVATAKDPANFPVGYNGKLRIQARGNFGEDALDGHYQIDFHHGVGTVGGGKPTTERLQQGIYLQSIIGQAGAFSQSH